MRVTAIILIFFLCTQGLFSGELETRTNIDRKVAMLVKQKNIAGLEQLSNRFRREKTRTGSGVWKLTVFYSAFSLLVPKTADDVEGWQGLHQFLDKWEKEFPDSPTPHIVRSILYVERAWKIRGSGLARQVKKENWKPFREKIREARNLLLEKKDILQEDPHWWVVMGIVARAEAWPEEKFMKILQKGMKKYPGYYQMYFSAVNYLSPLWYGNSEKIESFARFATENTRDKEGNALYARIYWYASDAAFQGRLFGNSKVDWETMRLGIDDVLRTYPDQWNINNFAFFACAAKDKQKTRELIERIDKPLKEAWRGNYRRCRKWAYN